MTEVANQQAPEQKLKPSTLTEMFNQADAGEPFAKFLTRTTMTATSPYIGAGIWLLTQGEWAQGLGSLMAGGLINVGYEQIYLRYKDYPDAKKAEIRESLYAWGEKVRKVKMSKPVRAAGDIKDNVRNTIAQKAIDFGEYLESDEFENLPATVIQKEIDAIVAIVEKGLKPIVAVGKKIGKVLDLPTSEELTDPYRLERRRVRRTVASFASGSVAELKNDEREFLSDLQYTLNNAVSYNSEHSPSEVYKELIKTAIGELIEKTKKGTDDVKAQYLRMMARRLFLEAIKKDEAKLKATIDPVWRNELAKKILYSDANLSQELALFVKNPPLEAAT